MFRQKGFYMAKYNMSEQESEKVFSKLLGDMDIVGAIENIMEVNGGEENNDMAVDKDLLDIKVQLAELKTDLAMVKDELVAVKTGLAHEKKARIQDEANSLHDKLLDLLARGSYRTYTATIRKATLDMGQGLFNDIIQDVEELIHSNVMSYNSLGALVSATNKYANRNHLNAEQIENL